MFNRSIWKFQCWVQGILVTAINKDMYFGSYTAHRIYVKGMYGNVVKYMSLQVIEKLGEILQQKMLLISCVGFSNGPIGQTTAISGTRSFNKS